MYRNILHTIGHTPLVALHALNPNPGVTLYAKLEGFNPTGSIKDRIALKMIQQAEAAGDLTPGRTIIEATSGNTGIGLAMIGAVKGYPVEIVMSEAVSRERRTMIRAFGARVILTDARNGTDGAIHRARELVRRNPKKYFMPDQFTNRYNKLVHYKTTAEEIWHDTGGRVDYFVSAIGTSGTIMGVGKALKENDPRVRVVSAQPVRGHYIQGLKNMEEAIVPAIYDPSVIDQTVMVDTETAFAMTRRIINREGIFAGMSSGAALYAAQEIARKVKSGVIVVIFPDRGEKYLSTPLFESDASSAARRVSEIET